VAHASDLKIRQPEPEVLWIERIACASAGGDSDVQPLQRSSLSIQGSLPGRHAGALHYAGSRR
jgi:hypothetical protein